MKTVLGKIRRCDEEYHLFAPGDRVAIGVSGGKDSMLLLKALSLYRYVRHGDFSLQAITLTSGKEKPDTSALEAYAAEVGVPIHIEHTDIYEILFDIRKDKHPCALCAKMRRSILCQRAQQLGCNKLALAHNREDVLETFLMSLIFEGRLHTFHPKTLMSKTGVTVIGIDRSGEILRMPSPTLCLEDGDVLLFIGKKEDIDCAVDYLDSNKNEPAEKSSKKGPVK